MIAIQLAFWLGNAHPRRDDRYDPAKTKSVDEILLGNTVFSSHQASRQRTMRRNSSTYPILGLPPSKGFKTPKASPIPVQIKKWEWRLDFQIAPLSNGPISNL